MAPFWLAVFIFEVGDHSYTDAISNFQTRNIVCDLRYDPNPFMTEHTSLDITEVTRGDVKVCVTHATILDIDERFACL